MITVESVLFLALCACQQGQSTVFRTKQKQKSVVSILLLDGRVFLSLRFVICF